MTTIYVENIQTFNLLIPSFYLNGRQECAENDKIFTCQH